MRQIFIKSSNIQFRNPNVGQPTRAVEAHYNGRRVVADVDGEERMFRFKPTDLAFDIDEDDMIAAINIKLDEEESRQGSE